MADEDIWVAVSGLAGEDIWRVRIFGGCDVWIAVLGLAGEDIWRMRIFGGRF